MATRTSEMKNSITTRKLIGTTRTTTSRTTSTTMWTPMTTLTHCTSTIAWRITTCTEPARIVSQSLIITLTFLGSSWVLHLSPHLHVIPVCCGCLSLTRRFPLSTSSPSSCPSSFPSSSSSTTSCPRSCTRRTWKTCATPRRTRVRTLMTSSTPPQMQETRPWCGATTS